MDRPLRLVLLRHAKSDWSTPGLSDFARPLNARGRRDAPRVGEELLRRGWRCSHVLCSAAQRARETWAAIEPILGPGATVRVSEGLYLAGVDSILAELAGLPAGASSVLAIGHNPGWEEAVAWFSGQSPALKTANAALLEGPAPWTAPARASWTLVDLIRPGDIG